MTKEELASFNEADKKVHPVETQWHYPIMTKFGYAPINKTGVGFVRKYTYEKDGHKIVCSTGVSGDHWEDWTIWEENRSIQASGGEWRSTPGGWWSTLEKYMEKLSENS